MEAVKKKEDEWIQKLKMKDFLLDEEQYKNKQLEDKIEELKKELDQVTSEKLKVVDLQLQHDSELDKKDTVIHSLEEDIEKLKDEIMGKNAAIAALSQTLVEKADENKKLAESLSLLKN